MDSARRKLRQSFPVDEMAEDGLSILDIENAILSGEIATKKEAPKRVESVPVAAFA
jgi:hypothetical protein